MLAGLLAGPLAFLGRVALYEPARGRGFFSPGTWTLQNFAAVTDRHGLSLLAFTVAFGCAVAVLTVSIAYPLALWVRGLSRWGRSTALVTVLLPKLASALVILFGLQQLLGDTGPVNTAFLASRLIASPVRLSRNLVGAAIGETYSILPYAVLLMFLQFLRIDPGLEAAARGLGASRWQSFRRVTLPLSVPGIVLAAELALMWGLGAFLAPMLLGGPAETTLSVEVYRQAFEYGRWPRAAAIATLLLAVVAGVLGLFRLLTGSCRRAQ
jgi:ABC-type spermidine/putrescine transport system permease subunit I